ncbi:Hypothetical predicted protein, partial [Paramuricea clavata]
MALQQNQRLRQLRFLIYTFTSVFTKPSGEINGDEDEYEDITNVTNIGELQVSGPDGIPARILKECSCSIAPSLCELFNLSLLVGRLPVETQIDGVDDVASNWSSVTSGVPQGSILGPLLFVLFINDLPNIIPEDSDAALYADDAKTFRKITSEVDGQHLQQTLTYLTTCSNTNNIKFNESKCKVLTVSRKKKPITFAYHLGSTNLHHVQEEKDLGVIMTGNLSWNFHVQSITSKANKLLGLLRRTCPLLTDVRVRRTL